MMRQRFILAASMSGLLLAVAACSPAKEEAAPAEAAKAQAGEAEKKTEEEGLITLSEEQMKVAGIKLVAVSSGGAGAITVPAVIEADPQGMQVVAAGLAGRVVALNRNLGQPVQRGETLAIIESVEAASLNAEIEAARARLRLAESQLRREERLFQSRVSPEQDVIAARAAATEARIAVRLAEQRLSATGGGGGALNRIAVKSPLSGQVIARTATLGQTVAAEAEIYRVANLSRVSISLSLAPDVAARVKRGTAVEIVSGERRVQARINFISPMLDEATKLVSMIAVIDNRGGQWRVGEPVSAAIAMEGTGGAALQVPQDAVQQVDGQSVVFVRTANGFRAVPVTLGNPSGDNVTVTSGLKGGEQIASTGSYVLKAELGKGEAEHGH